MSDNDLIRRGDALEICTDYGFSRADECRDAIAALPSVTVGVKPLVWDDRDYDWCWWSEDGDYRVRLDGAFHCDKHGVTMSSHTSLEAAKAAAQADYEARILDALTPTSVDASQPADPAVNAPKTVVLQSQPVRYCPICDIADCATHREPVAVTTPDPAAIRDAALREAAAEAEAEGWLYQQPMIPFTEREEGSRDCAERIASAILALIKKGAADA